VARSAAPPPLRRPARPRRVAAIDVGSNSIRCIVAEIGRQGRYRVLDDEKETVRLGAGVAAGGRITTAAWERARVCLLRMRKIAEGLGAERVEAVATSAVREAANGPRFLAAMERETGLRVRAIGGEREGELAARSALHHFPPAGGPFVVADIGGGSVEVAFGAGRVLERVVSARVGALSLTEAHLGNDPPRPKELRALRKAARRALRDALGSGAPPATARLIASGGTLSAVGVLANHARGERYDSVHGQEVLRSDVVHLLAMLERLPLRERRRLPGLSPDRAEIIVGGVTLLDELMAALGANKLLINETGIREGLVIELLEGTALPGRRRRGWRAGAEDFARACGVDLQHARHVRDLALPIYDALAPAAGLEARDRELLEAAAILHDVGYFISYPKHHKHSYHLIRHAELLGFSPREKELVANVARYHRRALPKKSHPAFAALARPDRERVRQLAGILRVADGLDRRRAGAVTGVGCSVTPRTVTLRLEGTRDLSVERHGAAGKGLLLEDAFGRRLALRLPRPPAPPAGAPLPHGRPAAAGRRSAGA